MQSKVVIELFAIRVRGTVFRNCPNLRVPEIHQVHMEHLGTGRPAPPGDLTIIAHSGPELDRDRDLFGRERPDGLLEPFGTVQERFARTDRDHLGLRGSGHQSRRPRTARSSRHIDETRGCRSAEVQADHEPGPLQRRDLALERADRIVEYPLGSAAPGHCPGGPNRRRVDRVAAEEDGPGVGGPRAPVRRIDHAGHRGERDRCPHRHSVDTERKALFLLRH